MHVAPASIDAPFLIDAPARMRAATKNARLSASDDRAMTAVRVLIAGLALSRLLSCAVPVLKWSHKFGDDWI